MKKNEFMNNPMVPKESQVVTACLRFLNGVGIFGWRNNNSGVYRGRRAGKDVYSFNGILGVADILAVCPLYILGEVRNQNIENKYAGHILCIECKRPGKLNGQSDGQKDFQQMIEKNKGIYILCDSWEMLEQKLKELNIIK